nr:HD-GYP domain-containing protein [Desulfovibrio sp.]
AYVRIVLESLQRLGTFPDIIDEDFIVKVVRSAPLHDIGKIMVPDAILNKPGKLTDEEYALMKTHAAAGGEVIGHIISIVPDSDYLDIAKDIATHHHEKWNGQGYPDGLSGDAIPLAARVMAIADVFDALVSNRPYKKVFSLEQAFAILREESGKLFDPRIVDAFFAAEDEVVKVEEQIREPDPVEGVQQLMPRFFKV